MYRENREYATVDVLGMRTGGKVLRVVFTFCSDFTGTVARAGGATGQYGPAEKEEKKSNTLQVWFCVGRTLSSRIE